CRRALVVRERHATISLTPAADAVRPPVATPVKNLFVAGDWVQTGLPATIEGAVQAGREAAHRALEAARRRTAPPLHPPARASRTAAPRPRTLSRLSPAGQGETPRVACKQACIGLPWTRPPRGPEHHHREMITATALWLAPRKRYHGQVALVGLLPWV